MILLLDTPRGYLPLEHRRVWNPLLVQRTPSYREKDTRRRAHLEREADSASGRPNERRATVFIYHIMGATLALGNYISLYKPICMWIYCMCVCVCVSCVCLLSIAVDSLTGDSQPNKEPAQKKAESRRAERLLAAGQKIKRVLVSRWAEPTQKTQDKHNSRLTSTPSHPSYSLYVVHPGT